MFLVEKDYNIVWEFLRSDTIVTRKDVAERAGVSVTVVSRVINNKGYVSKEKRERVEKVIKELGYTPNLIARGLKTNETKQLMFYAPDITNPFYMEVYQGMEDYAMMQGYTIVVSRHFSDAVIRQRRFDGLIMYNVSTDKQDKIRELGIPVVVTDYNQAKLSIPSVGIDMREGARKAVSYLVSCGHRDIGFVTNSENRLDQRYLGYVDELQNCNIEFDEEKIEIQKLGDSMYEQGYNAGVNILNKEMNITSLFVFNDAMAIGLMAALNERGVRVPEDISVIGFDNILVSRYTIPPLTTIHIPKYEQGWESTKMLINMIKGKTVEEVTLHTSLVERDSVRKI